MTRPSLPPGPDLWMEAHGAPFRVLLIGTSAYNADLLREVGELGGLGVEVVRDPQESVQRLRDDTFDVVVVDLPHPQMRAEEIYRGICHAKAELADRVVFLADDLNEPTIRRFLAEVGRPFLTQPFDTAQLYDLVVRVGLGDRMGPPDDA